MDTSNLSKAWANLQKSAKQHAPEILTGIGIGGMIFTTISAVRATPKALQLIEDKKKDMDVDQLTPIETIKAAWKPYVPAAISGVVATSCLICANSEHLRRNSALAAAYQISTSALTEYKEQVVETIGEKKEQVVRDKVKQKQVETISASENVIHHTGNGNTLCLDPLSGRLFRSSMESIKRAENEINKEIIHSMCGSASLNEFYAELGLDYIDLGDPIGWNVDNLLKLDIGSCIAKIGDKEEPCIVVGHHHAPSYEY